MLRSLLIDPFQKKIHEIEIEDSIENWHKWCDCECFDYAYCGSHFNQRVDIWVDDNGLLRQPVYPGFKWKDRLDPLIGYGLILATTAGGDTISSVMPLEYALAHVEFEKWEVRLNPEDWFDQLSRLYYYKGNSR